MNKILGWIAPAAFAAMALTAGSASAAIVNVFEAGNGTVERSPIYVGPDIYFGVNIFGTNDGIGGLTGITVTAEETARVTGDWSYLTTDLRGSAFDPFYLAINGVTQLLSVNLNPGDVPQTGAFDFTVNPGDVFSFWINSVDGQQGQGQAIFSGLYDVEVAAIPVPAAGLMLLAGLGGLAVLRRRKTA